MRRVLLLLLAIALFTACRPAAAPAPTSEPPRISYLGRVDVSDPGGPRLSWGGTQVVVRFEGTALSLTLAERGESRYEVAIDGAPAGEPFAPKEGTHTYPIAKGLPPGVHVVVLTRRTEPKVGVTQLRAFAFPDGGRLLAPPAEPARRIELLGDSEMTGYGIECATPAASFSAETENATKAYPSLVARTLAADAHVLAYSGKGVYRNDPPEGPPFATYYRQAVPPAAWRANVVWIALGGNDYAPHGGPPDREVFAAAYRELVDLARARSPDAQIVLAVPAGVSDAYPEGFAARTNVRAVVSSIARERGDAKLHVAELPEATEADRTGCDEHTGAAFQAKLASIAAAKIAEIAGWR
ncbi:MAG: hypothetical protein KIT84_30405 [Labilithrix sp.]|nr:hypothetical protein [Labilithrix sp.]MCW5815378.1 hypothetical protein [Labilithrix sp.]